LKVDEFYGGFDADVEPELGIGQDLLRSYILVAGVDNEAEVGVSGREWMVSAM
jgi:hypothetical protein